MMITSTRSVAVLVALSGFVVPASVRAEYKSNTWAGYIYQSPNIGQSPPPVTFSSVTAMWTQPAVICTAPDAQVAIWVGFDGWTGSTSSTVEQAGTIAVCGNTPIPRSYKVWWEMEAGSNSDGGMGFEVHPGDLMQASITFANGTYTMNVIDFTSGQSFQPEPKTCSSSVVCNRGTAEWIVERPGGENAFPLAAFGTLKFADLGFKSSSADVAGNFIDMIDKNTGTTLSTCNTAPFLPPPREFTIPQDIIQLPIECNWLAAQ